MKRRGIRYIALLLFSAIAISLNGCSTTDSKASPSAAPKASSSTSADKTGWPKELVIVLLPGEDTPEVLSVRKAFEKDFSDYLGIKVTEYHATDYNAAIEAMRTGHASVALLGPFSYVHAVDRAGAECFATTAKDGVSVYQSLIITRADSKVKTLADLKGKTFALVDPESTSGNVVPCNEILNAIKDPKLTFDDLHINGKFFSSVTFAGSHPNSLQGVYKGDVDAGAVSSSTFRAEINKGNVDESKIKIIHTSPDIPSSPWCYQKNLPQNLKDLIKKFITTYDNEDYWIKVGGKKAGDKTKYSYVAVNDSAYTYVRELRDKYNLKD